MTDTDIRLQKRFAELAERAYQNGVYATTPFLSLPEQEVLLRMRREIGFVPLTLLGGMENAERKIACFGDERLCGYALPESVATILCKPAMEKFSEELTHRDFLGALMNLGIERDTIGDIVQLDGRAWIFCLPSVSAHIRSNLKTVRHTTVECEQTNTLPQRSCEKTETIITVASLRIDAVISGVYRISRETASTLCNQGKVFVDGRTILKGGTTLSEGDSVSVRGYGRFFLAAGAEQTKKGRLRIRIRQ